MNDSSRNDSPERSDAFEFVVGTLRGAERERFERRLQHDATLQTQVQFWEEQLFGLHAETVPMPPPPALWAQIEDALPPLSEQRQRTTLSAEQAATPTRTRLQRMLEGWREDWLQWALPSAITAILFLFLLPLQERLVPAIQEAPLVGDTGDIEDNDAGAAGPSSLPNPSLTVLPDYVAVMTETDGKAVVTALTTGDGQALTLEFSTELDLTGNEDLQIWALSKRDSQIRSLVVLDSDESQSVALDTAQWRLIKDAEFLLLTREEKGGSSIDEPSSDLIARGYCVRLKSGSA